MQVKQVYSLVNDIAKEVLGIETVLNEDLSNVVEMGSAVLSSGQVDNYVKSLIDRIGKVVFVNRPYAGSVPSILMDGWEFGSILQKITMELPTATENESWELQDGQSYDPNIFYKPVVEAKFFNKKVTFELKMSIAERQVKESFTSATQLNAFLSMIQTAIENAMTIRIDGLIMRTINNMIGETIAAEYADKDYSAKSGVRAINVLKLYNDKFGTNLTTETMLEDKEFDRFFAYVWDLTKKRMSKISTIFNIGGKDRFTPADRLHSVMLTEVASATKFYLYSDTFNKEDVQLPNTETVPFWQGSGKSYELASDSKINIKTASGADVEVSGILGVMFDRDACAVCNQDRRVTSSYNPVGEFYNNFYKYDCESINDTNENFVVFFAA